MIGISANFNIEETVRYFILKSNGNLWTFKSLISQKFTLQKESDL